MNDLNDIDYKMMQVVDSILLRFKIVWVDNPIISLRQEHLSVTNRILASKNAEMVDTPDGITKDKTALHLVIVDEAYIIKQGLVLVLNSKNMLDEAELLSYSKSRLSAMLEAEFILEVIDIYEKAMLYAPFLLPLSITQVQIDKLIVDNNLFSKLIKQHQLASKKYNTLVKFIDTKINEFRVIFKEELDKAVEVYASSNKDFVKAYFNARRRHKKPGRHKHYTVDISGIVYDRETNRPLKGVTVMAGAKNKFVVTDANGRYKIKVYKTGLENITFTYVDPYDVVSKVVPKTFKNNAVVIDAVMSKSKYYDYDKFSE